MKRYNSVYDGIYTKPNEMVEEPHGDWVRYEDVEAVLKSYVKPKRYEVKLTQELHPGSHPIPGFCVWAAIGGVHAERIPTREAAERIAAIYEEVMP